MELTPQNVSNLWLSRGELTDPVVALFALAGRKIINTDLHAAREQTQQWIRIKNQERWQLPGQQVSDLAAFMETARDLLMIDPVQVDRSSEFDGCLIGGSTFLAILHRLRFALSSMPRNKDVSILASDRVVSKDEYNDMGQYNIPMLNRSEADAARLALAVAVFSEGVTTSVITAPKQGDGSRARTDETVMALMNTIDNTEEQSLVFVSHQPYACRQMLTYNRLLKQFEYKGKACYVAADPLRRREDMLFTPDGNWIARLLDEACRLIYELSLVHDPVSA